MSSASKCSDDTGDSEVQTDPDITHQTEFSFGNDSDDEDEIVTTKDEPTETDLGDFFGSDIGGAREWERESRVAQPESSIFADRTPLDTEQNTEQNTIVHEVADDQKTLEGEDASGTFTRIIEEARGEDGK